MVPKLLEKFPRASIASARYVRSGAIPVPRSLDGAALRAVGTSLRRRLDALADDPDFTPKERQAEASRAFAETRAMVATWKTKAANLMGEAATVAKRLAARVSAFENSLSPVAVERVKRRAEALGRLDPKEQKLRLDEAVDERDHEFLIAASLAHVDDREPRRALGVLLAPNDFAAHIELAPQALGLTAAVQVFEQGLGHLENVVEPWATRNYASPVESLDLGHRGFAAAGMDVAKLVPWDWPIELAAVAVPTGAEPPQSTSPASVGGAA